MGIVYEQEMELEKQNRKLQKEHDSLVQELRFMKKLIRDVFHKQSSSSWNSSNQRVRTRLHLIKRQWFYGILWVLISNESLLIFV